MKLPIIIMLALMPLVLTAYAEVPPSHVDVYDYPFNITLLEGGNFTLYNNATNNIYFDGAFEGMVYCGSISGNSDCDGFNPSKTFELPANVFTPDTYYLKDKSISGSNLVSSITIESPTPVYVAPPTPVYVPPTPEVVSPVEVIPEVTGVHTWCNSPCSDDSPVITFNDTSTVATTPAVNFGATSNATIGTYTSGLDSKVSELEEEIKLLKVERDEWKDLAKALMKLLNI